MTAACSFCKPCRRRCRAQSCRSSSSSRTKRTRRRDALHLPSQRPSACRVPLVKTDLSQVGVEAAEIATRPQALSHPLLACSVRSSGFRATFQKDIWPVHFQSNCECHVINAMQKDTYNAVRRIG
mmetsp:Transcript_173491/g.556464  ORF Transcript_173491/g.556464 Transcript_173491/m.556464 type:complete len:125 (-) Transcript_173491:84-458(-)